MSTFPMHLMDYLKVDIQYGSLRTGLLASLGSYLKKMFAPVERAAAVAVILLVAALIISVFMKLGEAGALNAYYCNACDAVPALFVAPQ
jgi:uncharacterized membrane protein (DUF106 family)